MLYLTVLPVQYLLHLELFHVHDDDDDVVGKQVPVGVQVSAAAELGPDVGLVPADGEPAFDIEVTVGYEVDHLFAGIEGRVDTVAAA